jgi:cyclic pyranopterin phosphate synthase
VNAALVSVDRLRVRGLSLPSESLHSGPLLDRLQRPLTDLRLSVTDRCNFRCTYCMPRSNLGPVVQPSTRSKLLTFEELTSIASAFVQLGVQKVRVTGGEPLVRKDLPDLIEQLSLLPIRDLCLTTNGSLLAGQAKALAAAGLGRVTVSLDALDEPTFHRMADTQTPLSRVLAGIDAARESGLNPVKINMVVQRGVNEHCIVPMAAWARREGLELRFIEYMDVGCSNGWKPSDVLTAGEIKQRIHERWPLEPLVSSATMETAERYRYCDGGGRIGLIASISRPFCAGCTRARVSSTGDLYPCLFAPVGYPLTDTLRQGGDLRALVAELWRRRTDRYSELRADSQDTPLRPEMSAIGG